MKAKGLTILLKPSLLPVRAGTTVKGNAGIAEVAPKRIPIAMRANDNYVCNASVVAEEVAIPKAGHHTDAGGRGLADQARRCDGEGDGHSAPPTPGGLGGIHDNARRNAGACVERAEVIGVVEFVDGCGLL